MPLRRFAKFHRSLQEPVYDTTALGTHDDSEADNVSVTSSVFSELHDRMIEKEERGRIIIPNLYERIRQIKRVKAAELEEQDSCPNPQGFPFNRGYKPTVQPCYNATRPSPFPYLKRPQPPPFPMPTFDRLMSNEKLDSWIPVERRRPLSPSDEDENHMPIYSNRGIYRSSLRRVRPKSKMPEIEDGHKQAASLASPYENPSSPFSRNAYELDTRQMNGHATPFSYRSTVAAAKAAARVAKKVPFPKRNQIVHVRNGIPTIEGGPPGSRNTYVEIQSIG